MGTSPRRVTAAATKILDNKTRLSQAMTVKLSDVSATKKIP